MRRARVCPVCGRPECGLHDSVLAFSHLVDRCALIGAALLTGLLVVGLVLAM